MTRTMTFDIGRIINLKRHRRFYANFFVMCPPHPVHVFGVERVWGSGERRGDKKAGWCRVMGVTDCRNVTKKGLAQGVPAAYVHHIMKQYFMWHTHGDRSQRN